MPRTSSGTSSWQGICAGLAPPSLRSSLPWRCDCDSHGLQLPLQLKRPLLWRRGGVQPRRAQLSTCAWRAHTALRCEATSAAGRPRPSKPPASVCSSTSCLEVWSNEKAGILYYNICSVCVGLVYIFIYIYGVCSTTMPACGVPGRITCRVYDTPYGAHVIHTPHTHLLTNREARSGRRDRSS